MNKNKIKRDFSFAAPQYEKHALLQKQVAWDLFSEARRLFEPEARILDGGCGSGFLADFSGREGLEWHIHQLDIAYGMCHVSYEKADATICGDAEFYPYKEDSFDGFFSSLMLQWVDSFPVALSEIKRVLKPEKCFIVSTFGGTTLHELKESFAAIDDVKHVNDFMTLDEIKQQVEDAGFSRTIIEEKPIIQKYEDVMHLLKSIKVIGAHYKGTPNEKYSAAKSLFHRLQEEYYSHYHSNDNMIEATWDVITIKGIK